jgi:hypothetical protein
VTGPWRILGVALAVLPVSATAVTAQHCRGAAPDRPGWVAVAIGRAAESANLFGADIAWRTQRGLLGFADAGLTAYPRPDPGRWRGAVGIGVDAVHREGFGICPTVAIEREGMEDFRVQRIPIGVAVGWTKPLDGDQRHVGVTLEPFFVHQRVWIERFGRTSNFVSGRAGVAYGVRRLVTGLVFEHAFDEDARWNARARVGITFQ